MRLPATRDDRSPATTTTSIHAPMQSLRLRPRCDFGPRHSHCCSCTTSGWTWATGTWRRQRPGWPPRRPPAEGAGHLGPLRDLRSLWHPNRRRGERGHFVRTRWQAEAVEAIVPLTSRGCPFHNRLANKLSGGLAPAPPPTHGARPTTTQVNAIRAAGWASIRLPASLARAAPARSRTHTQKLCTTSCCTRNVVLAPEDIQR